MIEDKHETSRIRTLLRKLSSGIIGFLVRSNSPPAIVTFVVYLLTMAPGVTGLDSAELATGAHTLGIVHPTGYPLYLLLAKIFTLLPIRSVAYRVNLMSAVFAALTVWLVACIATRVSRNRWAAWLGAGVLGFSYSFWGLAVVAEVYTLHAFLLALTLLMLMRWRESENDNWVMAGALVYGLSLTNHVSGVLFFPAFLWFLFKQAGVKRLLRLSPLLIVLMGVGLSVYLYLPLRDQAGVPLNYVRSYYGVDLTTVSGIWWMISGKAYRLFAFPYDLSAYLREVGTFATQLWRNYTALGVVLGMIGAVGLHRRRAAVSATLTMVFLATVFFFAGYGVVDKATMFLPAYLVWAIWLAEGASMMMESVIRFSDRIPTWRPILTAIVRGSFLAVVVMTCWLNFRWVDMSDHYGPEVMARQVMGALQPDAMVVGYWSSAVVLEYFQTVEGWRPDVEIFNRSRFEVAEYYHHWVESIPHEEAMQRVFARERTIFEAAAKQRPLYGVEYDPMLANEYEYRPMGTVFHLVPRN
jgi:hypothetical protein